MDDTQYPTPPPGVKVLKNGAGYNEETKRICAAPGTYGPAPANITSENAAAMAKIGRDKTKAAIASAIVDQAKARGLKVNGPAEAVAIAAAGLFDSVLQDQGSLWDRNRTLWDIAKRAGLIQEDSTTASRPTVNIQLSADAIRELFAHTGGQVIDI